MADAVVDHVNSVLKNHNVPGLAEVYPRVKAKGLPLALLDDLRDVPKALDVAENLLQE